MLEKEKVEMNNELLELKLNVVVTGQDVDDIMSAALDGGICYWCSSAKVEGGYLGEYASDQISRGGVLRLFPYDDEAHRLDKDALLNGIRMYLEAPDKPYDILESGKDGLKIDTCEVDATVADMIVQYAVFGELVYG